MESRKPSLGVREFWRKRDLSWDFEEHMKVNQVNREREVFQKVGIVCIIQRDNGETGEHQSN